MPWVQPIPLGDDRALRLVARGDLDELFALVRANHAHLAPWMPWAVQPQRDASAAFLRAAEEQFARGDGAQFAITDAGRIIGTAGFHAVDRVCGATTVGYWLAADAQGRGTMTLTVAAMLDLAFDVWGLRRVALRAAVENARSRAVAERLGFVAEGVLREAEVVGDRRLDLVVYSMLADGWRAS